MSFSSSSSSSRGRAMGPGKKTSIQRSISQDSSNMMTLNNHSLFGDGNRLTQQEQQQQQQHELHGLKRSESLSPIEHKLTQSIERKESFTFSRRKFHPISKESEIELLKNQGTAPSPPSNSSNNNNNNNNNSSSSSSSSGFYPSPPNSTKLDSSSQHSLTEMNLKSLKNDEWNRLSWDLFIDEQIPQMVTQTTINTALGLGARRERRRSSTQSAQAVSSALIVNATSSSMSQSSSVASIFYPPSSPGNRATSPSITTEISRANSFGALPPTFSDLTLSSPRSSASNNTSMNNTHDRLPVQTHRLSSVSVTSEDVRIRLHSLSMASQQRSPTETNFPLRSPFVEVMTSSSNKRLEGQLSRRRSSVISSASERRTSLVELSIDQQQQEPQP